MKNYFCLILLMMAATSYARFSGDRIIVYGENYLSGPSNYHRHEDKYYGDGPTNHQCKTIAKTPREWVAALNDLIYENRDGDVCPGDDIVQNLAGYPDNQQLQLSTIDPTSAFWNTVGHGSGLTAMTMIRELRAEGLSTPKEIKEGLFMKIADKIGIKTHLLKNTNQKWFLQVMSRSGAEKLMSSQSYQFLITTWDNLFHHLENVVYCKWVDGRDLCNVDHPVSIQFDPSIKRGLKEKSLEEIIGCSEGVVRCCYKNPHSQFCEFHQILLEKRSHGGKIEAVRYYADIQHGRTLQEARALFSAVFEYYPNDNDRLEEALTAELDYTGGLGVLMRGDINMYDMEPIGASLFLART